jgi:hypothetical protein
MRRTIIATAVAALLTLGVVGGSVAAAANPSPTGTGQPSQSCQSEPAGPPGLESTTNGFATQASNVYANPGSQGGVSSGNSHVVAQYDVACYQFSQHH